MEPARFYTFPPSGIEYPYLIVNPRNYRVLYKRRWRHAIVDCGVEMFRNPAVKDYSRSFLERWKMLARHLSKVFEGRVFVTIPDYPDDLNPGSLGDNVERTLRNVERFITVDGVDWLPVIQSRYLDRLSFVCSASRLRKMIGSYPRVAIGTVCKTNRLSFIEYCCKVARKYFPNSHLHAFGLTLKALPRVVGKLSSWDSLVPDTGRHLWRRRLISSFDIQSNALPREYGKQLSYKTLNDRQKYFIAYLARVNTILTVTMKPGDG